MLILFVMLVTALVPITREYWATALGRGMNPNTEQRIYCMQLPARCFWRPQLAQPNVESPVDDQVGPDGVMSYLLLVVSYAWKVSTLFERCRRGVEQWTRTKPLRTLETQLKRARWHRHSVWVKTRYSLLVSTYVTLLAMVDFSRSFAASLWIVTVGLIWGSLHLWVPRRYLPADVRNQESTWGFGQILPMMLLLLPLLAIGEQFYGEYLGAVWRSCCLLMLGSDEDEGKDDYESHQMQDTAPANVSMSSSDPQSRIRIQGCMLDRGLGARL